MRSISGSDPKTIGLASMKPYQAYPATEKKAAEDVWEVRPGGLLVQKSATPSVFIPTIRVKVKHNAIFHEIYISSQATFGELKKQLWARTGIHPLDQKVLYRDKERGSAVFLDSVGVKDKSKLVVVEDPAAKAKRLLELRRTEKVEKAAKSLSVIGVEVDKLASKVLALEGIVNNCGRVVETEVSNLIELLMTQLVKLDDIIADDVGVKLERRNQIKRVQKHVETLDAIKVKNTQSRPNIQQVTKQEMQPKLQAHYSRNHHQNSAQDYYYQSQQSQKQYQHTKAEYQQKYVQKNQPLAQKMHQAQEPVTEAYNLDFFDSLFMPSTSNPTSTQTYSTTTAASSTASSTSSTQLDWELF